LYSKKNWFFNPHVFFWLLFITYEVAVSYSVTGAFSSWVDYFTYYSINIALFYLHTYVILNNSNAKRASIVLIIAFSILEIAGYLVLKYCITSLYLLIGVYKTPIPPPISFIRDSSWRAIYFMGLASAYAYNRIAVISRRQIDELDRKSFQEQLRAQKMEQSLLISENAFLKAQINPHFIFNVLSFIHSTISKYSEVGADLIISVSDLMRYALAEIPPDGKVLLSSEIEHIENYISLSKQRYGNLNLILNVNGDITRIKIIPLLLITIVENVFKYANLWDTGYPALINVNVKDNELQLTVENGKIKRTENHSSGIGMSNVTKRLKHYYYDNYSIDINQDNSTYKLILKITFPSDDVLHN
jgi:two-component system LytT family sensor kinase